MEQFLQQLANGMVLGATYGLIALGYTMVYGILQLINFAHGEIFMLGAFGGLAAYNFLELDAVPAGVALPIMLVAAMATSVSVGVLMERFAYRPLRRAPRLAPLITAIGVSIALQEIVRLWYPLSVLTFTIVVTLGFLVAAVVVRLVGDRFTPKVTAVLGGLVLGVAALIVLDRAEGGLFPPAGAKSARPFPQLITGSPLEFGAVQIQRVSIVVVVVALGCMVALSAFVQRSKTGRAMQATAQDPDTARLMGIDTDRIIVTAFVLGGLLAAVAGIAQGLRFGQVDFRIGFIAGLKAFTAAVLGGIGNINGAVLGGFVIGLVESMATQYAPGQFGGGAWKDVWVFIVLIAVLVFRPQGLLGESVRERS